MQPAQEKTKAKRQPSQESWRLAIFAWSGTIEQKALATLPTRKRIDDLESLVFEDE